LSKEEESRKILLHNFVEKPGFSLLIRPKQLKIEKSIIHLVILRLIEKTERSGKKISSGNQ
jgi:hypothetical protein